MKLIIFAKFNKINRIESNYHLTIGLGPNKLGGTGGIGTC